MATWAENLIQFYRSLQPTQKLPHNIQWLYPQQSDEVMLIVEKFYYQYFNDNHQRTLLLGINPGRFGAGITGINFTAPKQLTEDCHIQHPYKMQSELSAEFIYHIIHQYGGVEKFYKHFFIGSVCPLGFVQNGININYYDDKQLLAITAPFIVDKLNRLLTFNAHRKKCICIGGEKNFRYLSKLNSTNHWFEEIIPLPHPRFIMQYRRRAMQQYADEYLSVLATSYP